MGETGKEVADSEYSGNKVLALHHEQGSFFQSCASIRRLQADLSERTLRFIFKKVKNFGTPGMPVQAMDRCTGFIETIQTGYPFGHLRQALENAYQAKNIFLFSNR